MTLQSRFIIKLYKSFSLIVVNTIMILLVVNAVLSFWYISDNEEEQKLEMISETHQPSVLFNDKGAPVDTGNIHGYYLSWYDYGATKNTSPIMAAEILKNYSDLLEKGLVYKPWLGFSEPAFKSKHVSVVYDEMTFLMRKTPNPEKKKGYETIRILTLGGSSTFGYSVADGQTWPAYLSSVLNKQMITSGKKIHFEVRNYGRAYYYPSQQTALLIDLLKSGQRPHLVIFMDGINTGPYQDWPEFNHKATEGFRLQQFPANETDISFLQSIKEIALVRFFNGIAEKLVQYTREKERKENMPAVIDLAEANPDLISGLIKQRFAQNSKISEEVCKLYGCKTLFFLQPNPRYQYNLDLYRLNLPQNFIKTLPFFKKVYGELRELDNYIDLSNMFEKWGRNRKAIIDDTHYSPEFNQFIAEHVKKFINLESLSKHRDVFNENSATGIARNPIQ